MKLRRRFRTFLRAELRDWRIWVTRAVMLLFAAGAGVAVVGFTWLSERALEGFQALRGAAWWLPLLWTPLVAASVVWVTRRWVAGAAGSGIPQVLAALEAPAQDTRTSALVSVKVSVAKLALTAWGLLGGLSIGREGPSVQVAAGILHAGRRWMPDRHVMSAHELLLAAIVLAGLMAVSILGNATYFGVIRVGSIGTELAAPAMLLALLCGLVGGLFSRLLIESLSGGMDRFSRWRARHPVRFALGCGLAVAVIGLASQGSTFGSGYLYTRGLLEGQQDAPVIYVVLKLAATWLSAWSGVPGGIFAPSLAIGAGMGSDVAAWFASPHTPALVALGMAGFLAAVTQAPLTAFIIVMEMVDGHAMVLSLMACSMVASLVSRGISPPIYPTLARQYARSAAPADAS